MKDPRSRNDESSLNDFYVLQKLAHGMDVAFPGPPESTHVEELERLFTSPDELQYQARIIDTLKGKFHEIVRGAILFDDSKGNSDSLLFSGAITFFSIHPKLLDSSIRSFVNWERVCPPSNLFRHLNPGLKTLLCKFDYCRVKCEKKHRECDSDCLRRALGLFLQKSLTYSASNLVDAVLPVKQGFHISLYKMPNDQGNIITDLMTLREKLRGASRKSNMSLLKNRRFLSWHDIEPELQKTAKRWRLDGIREAIPYLSDLFIQLTNLPLMQTEANIKALGALEQENGYSVGHFVEFAASLLIVPRTKNFYFLHFGLGHKRRAYGNNKNQETGSLPSGTLALFTHLEQPIGGAKLCILHALLSEVMSSLSRIEHAMYVSQLEAERERARARSISLVNYGHTLSHRLGPILHHFSSLKRDAKNSRAIGNAEMMDDLSLILQLNVFEDFQALAQHEKKERFLVRAGQAELLNLLSKIKVEWSTLIERQRDIEEVDTVSGFHRMNKVWASPHFCGPLRFASIGFDRSDSEGHLFRLGDFAYRELFCELLRNAVNYGTLHPTNESYGGFPVYAVPIYMKAEKIEGCPAIVLMNKTAKEPIYLNNSTWTPWPSEKEHSGPGMAIESLTRLGFGRMWYSFDAPQSMFMIGVHLTGLDVS